jgi:hypothetical protein
VLLMQFKSSVRTQGDEYPNQILFHVKLRAQSSQFGEPTSRNF